MTHSIRYAEGVKVLPILKPQDIVATATASSYVDLDNANWFSALVQFGNITSDSTDTITITVEASTAGTSNATEAAIVFQSRLFAAIDTDTLGAITTNTTAGVSVTAAEDNKGFWIDVDPSAVAATADRRFVRIVATPNAETAICLISMVAFLETRYPGNVQPSST